MIFCIWCSYLCDSLADWILWCFSASFALKTAAQYELSALHANFVVWGNFWVSWSVALRTSCMPFNNWLIHYSCYSCSVYNNLQCFLCNAMSNDGWMKCCFCLLSWNVWGEGWKACVFLLSGTVLLIWTISLGHVFVRWIYDCHESESEFSPFKSLRLNGNQFHVITYPFPISNRVRSFRNNAFGLGRIQNMCHVTLKRLKRGRNSSRTTWRDSYIELGHSEPWIICFSAFMLGNFNDEMGKRYFFCCSIICFSMTSMMGIRSTKITLK